MFNIWKKKKPHTLHVSDQYSRQDQNLNEAHEGHFQSFAYLRCKNLLSHHIYSQARLRGMGADHQSTHANCQRGEKWTTIAVRPRCVRPAEPEDWVLSISMRYLFLLHASVFSLDARPPSSQYVNKCVWHATMRRIEWYRDPGRGTSGPVVETLRVGVRRHQLPPRSKRKCTYITAWTQKDSDSGQWS